MPPRSLLYPISEHPLAYVGSEIWYLEITRLLPQFCQAYTAIGLQSDDDGFISLSFLFIDKGEGKAFPLQARRGPES